MTDLTHDPGADPLGPAGHLLRDVLDNPDSDAPRLVYADWLRENDQWERGEFVAIQCELATLPPSCLGNITMTKQWCATCGRVDELRRRELDIFSRLGIGFADGLLGPDWKVCGQGYGRVTFSNRLSGEIVGPFGHKFARGFVTTIRCSAADWLTHGQAILRREPISEVYFSDSREVLRILHALTKWTLRLDRLSRAVVYDYRDALIEAMPRQLREWGVGPR